MVTGPILLERCKSVLKVCSIHIELLAVVNSVHTVYNSLVDVTCAYTEYRSRNQSFICIYLALGLWEVIVQKKRKRKNKNISQETQLSEVRVGRAQLYSRVPVSHDSVTVSQHAQYQEPETESRWMELSLTMVLFTLDSFIYKS